MKRLETIVRSDKLSEVVSAIKSTGAKGVTVTSIKGQGSGERPMLRSGRGTTQFRAEYNIMDSIMTVVDDSEVPKVISAISQAAYTGKSGDGIVIVTDVDQVVNIASKKTDSSAL
ncbi:MAG: P-II family nitrogen regulator [Nitrosopumilus sp.]|uniref:P-II family nitrogen regulator n=1 Tax=Nitrosopumilus sp. TaxID=2024843 RepID=UPI0024728EBC|nr:P-II family nitrogen regulator [Nitrosopumilus sp.]MDH5432263.1 P-II family nitrogen regulator [Nitrosopumilus sp.]